MKVAFYLNNANISGVDLSRPDLGNPGCGGTQYMFAAASYYLTHLQDPDIQVVLLTAVAGVTPQGVATHVVGDVFQAASYAMEHDFDFLIYKASSGDYEETEKMSEITRGSSLGLIDWLQLVPSHRALMTMAASPNFKALACVEHEQLDILRDHPVFTKTTIVVDAISLHPYAAHRPPLPFNKRKKHVVYCGNMSPAKGFGRLAKAWPMVIEAVPDAALLVMGSGTLYNRNATLGQWGVAEERFEASQIRPYLAGPDGAPHPSVHFLGTVGAEKVDYFAHSMVGVANPIGWTEYFCISAVEMQAAGMPVLTGPYLGLFDTVREGETGYHVRSEKDLARRIIHFLKNPDVAQEMGRHALEHAERNYSFEEQARQWQALLHTLNRGQPPCQPNPKAVVTSWYQRGVRTNAALRGLFGAPNWWPPTHLIIQRWNKLKRNIKKLIGR